MLCSWNQLNNQTRKLEMGSNNVIGTILGLERIKMNLTSQQICDGLCSLSTYNRYECGRILPDKFMFLSLLERMGKNPNRVIYTITDEEEILSALMKKITDLMKTDDFEAIENSINEYSKVKKTRCKNIHLQFELAMRGDFANKKNDKDEALSFYKEALAQTCSQQVVQTKDLSLHTIMEFGLLYKISYLEEFDSLNKMVEYLKKLDDNHILKIKFYGDMITDLVNLSDDKWKSHVQLQYIEDGLAYKKRIKQSNGLSQLIEMKKARQDEITEDEGILIELDRMLG